MDRELLARLSSYKIYLEDCLGYLESWKKYGYSYTVSSDDKLLRYTLTSSYYLSAGFGFQRTQIRGVFSNSIEEKRRFAMVSVEV